MTAAAIAQTRQEYGIFSFPVLVAALGYFVDLYDLVLFGTTRIAALKAFGVAEADLFTQGMHATSMQTLGLVIGGLLFGMLADKFGRARLMFISIITYSLATLAGPFAPNLDVFMGLRLVAGLGLAGEVGLAVTLVAEMLPQNKRGYGTAFIASFGLSGAVAAALAAQHFDWKTCYFIGGGMGLLLLCARAMVAESPLFLQQQSTAPKGKLRMLFGNAGRLRLFALCVLAGAPVNFILFVLAAFAPELTGSLGLSVPMAPAVAIMYGYIGIALGDLVAGVLSQRLHTRRRVAQLFLLVQGITLFAFLMQQHGDNVWVFKAYYFALGFFAGIWVVICTIAVELFGTNLRATVGAAVPNFIRSTFLISSALVAGLKADIGLAYAAAAVGGIMIVLAFIAVTLLPETHHKELEYLET